MDLTQVLSILEAAGIDLTGREIAEAVWLAQFLPQLPVSNFPNETQDRNDTSEFVGSDFTEEAERAPSEVPQRENRTDIYSNKTNTQDNTSTSNIVPAAKVRIYSDRALPNARAIARALRPLMRRIPSKIDYELDEIATAQQIAEKYLLNLRVWAPHLKPAPTRWLEVALVVDSSTSMMVWQTVAQELYSLLIRQGAFRDVRMWRLDTESEQAPQLFYGNSDIESAPRSYQELFDASGKRLIIVLSDCVSKAWQNRRMFSWLAKLAPRANVTILQVWPQRLWKRTILGYVNTLVSARSPGLPNTQLIVEQRSAFGLSSKLLNKASNEPKRVPIPIVALEPHAISNWARMVAGVGHVWAPAIQIEIDSSLENNQDLNNQDRDNNIESDPRYLVEHFQATALPLTQKLAGLLASVPLQLPIMRLIQNSLLPSSEILHLSEFLTSGLIYRVESNTDNPIFEFVEGVRDLLRRTVSISETVKALQEVGEYINEHFGEGEGFAALIPNVNGVESLVLQEQTVPFAQLQAEVLESLGGIHRFTAQQLREKIAQYEVVQYEEASFEEKLPDENLQSKEFKVDIRKFYQAINPSKSLCLNHPEDRKYYIDFSSVRGGDIITHLKRKIAYVDLDDPTCNLLTAQIGCGKSTELLRLQWELEADGFHVVYFASSQDLEMSNVDVVDVLLSIAYRVRQNLEQINIAEPRRFMELLQGAWNILKDVTELMPNVEETVFLEQYSFSVRIREIISKAKSDPASRERLNRYFEPQKKKLLFAINQELLEPVIDKLKQQGKKGLVVIVDNLDRIDSRVKPWGRGQQEYLFIDQSEYLKKLSCHVVCTMPLSLKFSNEYGMLAQRFDDPKVLPMVPVKLPTGDTHSAGMALMREMVLARAFPELNVAERYSKILEIFDLEATLDRLCMVSGGHVRDVLLFLSKCIKREQMLPISRATLEALITASRNEMMMAISEQEWELLRRVKENKMVSIDKEYQQLIHSRFVFEYQDNGKVWFDVNPILAEAKELQ